MIPITRFDINNAAFSRYIYINNCLPHTYTHTQVCSCCKVCEGTRYVPGAVLYASCRPLESIPVHKREVKKHVELGGKKPVVFSIENPSEGMANNVGIQVQLPEGVDFVRARDERVPKEVAIEINGQRKVPDVYNATSRTVVWWPLPFDSWQSYIFRMKIYVDKEKAGNYSLVISSFQQTRALNVNATTFPYCQNPVTNISMTITTKGEIKQYLQDKFGK